MGGAGEEGGDKGVRDAQGTRGGLEGDGEVVWGRKEEKQGRGLLWERKTRNKGCGAKEKGRKGSKEAQPCSQCSDPPAEQRGAPEGVDPSPAPCLLPRARLLVCLHLPSSVKVSRESLTELQPLCLKGNCPVMPSLGC